VLAAAVRPAVFRRPYRLLDAALSVCLLVTAAELVPIPRGVRDRLAPSASVVERALFFDGEPSARATLSLDATSTAWALAFGAALLLLFWSARSIFERGGSLRHVLRGMTWLGLALAAVMFVQRATTPGLIYGFWRPITRASNPMPLGPFVNRNDIATWLIVACPVVFGYALTRIESRSSAPLGRDANALVDSRTLWLAAAVCLMMAALLASLSRSGLFGGAAALLVFAALAGRRLEGGRLVWLLVGVAGLIAVAAIYVNFSALLQRISDTLPSNLGGRPTVWRETWPMARDFLATGIGVGAFERGMLVYQRSTRLIFFNHAHNEYLQVLVEGGLLLAIPAVAAIAAGISSIRRRLAVDTTPVYWMRAGAASGMAAVAAQSIWDTGLRMPANAVLFAIVAAVALHEGDSRAPRTRR
jgi:O-antigen ligase